MFGGTGGIQETRSTRGLRCRGKEPKNNNLERQGNSGKGARRGDGVAWSGWGRAGQHRQLRGWIKSPQNQSFPWKILSQGWRRCFEELLNTGLENKRGFLRGSSGSARQRAFGWDSCRSIPTAMAAKPHGAQAARNWDHPSSQAQQGRKVPAGSVETPACPALAVCRAAE